jgi:curved DNA-binding protein CbpA
MSAPLAGKFQDHYEILGVDLKADIDTVQGAYSKLAQKYHPATVETGDAELFAAVNLAYEVLSDPVLRKEFDKLKGVASEEEVPLFSGLDFFVSLGREACLRMAVLSVLYDRRRSNPLRPSVSMRHLEMMLSATNDELIFALWYLKQRHLVTSDDKSSLQISVDGMDFLENNRPSPEVVMPLIKQGAVASAKYSPQAILHVASSPANIVAVVPEDVPLEAPNPDPREHAARPEPSSALKALRDALAGAGGRTH